MHTNTGTYIQIQTYVYIHACILQHTYKSMHARTNIIYTDIHMHAFIHTYIHTCIHTCMHIQHIYKHIMYTYLHVYKYACILYRATHIYESIT